MIQILGRVTVVGPVLFIISSPPKGEITQNVPKPYPASETDWTDRPLSVIIIQAS